MNALSFEAIGTTWAIDILDTVSSGTEEKLRSEIKASVEEFDATYSRFR